MFLSQYWSFYSINYNYWKFNRNIQPILFALKIFLISLYLFYKRKRTEKNFFKKVTIIQSLPPWRKPNKFKLKSIKTIISSHEALKPSISIFFVLFEIQLTSLQHFDNIQRNSLNLKNLKGNWSFEIAKNRRISQVFIQFLIISKELNFSGRISFHPS